MKNIGRLIFFLVLSSCVLGLSQMAEAEVAKSKPTKSKRAKKAKKSSVTFEEEIIEGVEDGIDLLTILDAGEEKRESLIRMRTNFKAEMKRMSFQHRASATR